MKKFFLIISALAGAAFALLFSNKTGKELRNELKKNANITDKGKILANALLTIGKNAAQEVTDFSKKEKTKITKNIQNIEQKVKKGVQKAKRFLKKNTEKLIKDNKN